MDGWVIVTGMVKVSARAVTDDLLALSVSNDTPALASDDGLAVLLTDGGIDRVTDNVGCDLINVNRRSAVTSVETSPAQSPSGGF